MEQIFANRPIKQTGAKKSDHATTMADCVGSTFGVCEWAFSDIVEKVGCENVNVDCSATSMKAFEHYGTDRKHAHALECLKQKCLLHSISEKVERGMKNVDKNIDAPR